MARYLLLFLYFLWTLSFWLLLFVVRGADQPKGTIPFTLLRNRRLQTDVWQQPAVAPLRGARGAVSGCDRINQLEGHF